MWPGFNTWVGECGFKPCSYSKGRIHVLYIVQGRDSGLVHTVREGLKPCSYCNGGIHVRVDD